MEEITPTPAVEDALKDLDILELRTDQCRAFDIVQWHVAETQGRF